MSTTDTSDQTAEPVRTNSRKREVTAVVTSMAVTIALGVVATGLVEKVGHIVKNRIAPPAKDEEN